MELQHFVNYVQSHFLLRLIIVFKSIIIPCKHGLDCSCSGRSPLHDSGQPLVRVLLHVGLPWLHVPRFYGVFHVHYGHLLEDFAPLASCYPPSFQCDQTSETSLTHDNNWFDAYPSSKFFTGISIPHGYTAHPSNHWHLIMVQPLRFINFDRPSVTTIQHDTTNACCIQLPVNFQRNFLGG